ncbi:calnexin homolog2 [Zea mays]|uniref:Calnexin homolog2 n=1 Tax=Zea mays TaxID=4577 RepID=A0A1D6J6E8_MAIZE|nr:calnexin homolog2 [Zea mays]
MEIVDEEATKPEGWLDDEPEEIPNPEYFELDRPDFDPIAAIGIEIWTMQDGILFDNILIADDEKVATSILEKTWKPKYDVEKEKEKAEEAAAGADGLSDFQKKIFDVLYKIADIPFLAPYKTKIIDVIEKGEKQPNITIGILVSVVIVFVTVLFKILFGGKKPVAPVKPAAEAKKPKAAETDGAGSSGDKDEKEDEKDETGPRRRTRRET